MGHRWTDPPARLHSVGAYWSTRPSRSTWFFIFGLLPVIFGGHAPLRWFMLPLANPTPPSGCFSSSTWIPRAMAAACPPTWHQFFLVLSTRPWWFFVFLFVLVLIGLSCFLLFCFFLDSLRGLSGPLGIFSNPPVGFVKSRLSALLLLARIDLSSFIYPYQPPLFSA